MHARWRRTPQFFSSLHGKISGRHISPSQTVDAGNAPTMVFAHQTRSASHAATLSFTSPFAAIVCQPCPAHACRASIMEMAARSYTKRNITPKHPGATRSPALISTSLPFRGQHVSETFMTSQSPGISQDDDAAAYMQEPHQIPAIDAFDNESLSRTGRALTMGWRTIP